MKIAQVAPVWYSIPPKKYGGTELVIQNLTQGLVADLHDVTVFATANSRTPAHLNATIGQGIVEAGGTFLDYIPYLYHVLSAVKKAKEFDVMHFHFTTLFDYVTLTLIKDLRNVIVTLHLNLPTDPEDRLMKKIWEEYLYQLPLVTISQAQKRDLQVNFFGFVYNGIDPAIYQFNDTGGEDMFWLSAIRPAKGTAEAIQTAISLNKKIRIAGVVNSTKERVVNYFKTQVEPYFKNPLVNFIGELDLPVKVKEYGKSKLFLFPLQWEEPFGLVLVESMACGTPVVAYGRGSIPEVIEDGVTGFIVNDNNAPVPPLNKRGLGGVGGNWQIKKRGLAGIAEAVERIYSMPDAEYKQMRRACRTHVEEHFGIKQMALGYESLYQKIITRT